MVCYNPTNIVGLFFYDNKMFKISKKSQYGLRAMVCIASFSGKNQICSTKMISEKEIIPFDFLEKIISKLEKAGLVKSKKGIQGGYFLAKPAKKISVEDIVSALEGKNPLVDCAICGRAKKCVSKNVWGKIEKSLDKTLNSIKLSKLI